MFKLINFQKGNYKKIIVRAWIIFLSTIAFFCFYIFAVTVNLFWLFGKMPDFKLLENPKSDQASEVYSSDNVLLGKYFIKNRTPVEFDSISPHIINSLISTEDIRFEKHSGVDFKATISIPFYILSFKPKGSSTLSQQLAKNLFSMRKIAEYKGILYKVPGISALIIKTKEWITAIQIERNYTKKEIITMYLNTVDFGNNAFGIESAAHTFFQKRAAQLNVNESALLVGMLQNPTKWNPISRPERAIIRRNIVLSQLVKYKYLSEKERSTLNTEPLNLHFKVEDYSQGLAPHFRAVLKKELERLLTDSNFDLYVDGLKIYTTIDSRMQKYAEESTIDQMKKLQVLFNDQWKGAKDIWRDDEGKIDTKYILREVQKSSRYHDLQERYGDNIDSIMMVLNKPVKMKVFTLNNLSYEKDTILSPMDSVRYHKRFLQCGFMSMDPTSGDIKAWVGGVNFRFFQYDHVKQGKRQPGSSFKPIIYTTAIDYKGYTPCTEIVDEPVVFSKDEYGQPWQPRNSTGTYTGQSLTLRQAIAQSVNTISAKLVKDLGPTRVIEYAKKLGIDVSHMEAVPSICLGTQDVSIYDLLGAYSTFVNGGVWTEPRFITRIEDRNGNIIQDFPAKTIEALSEQTSYLMVHMLKGGTQEKGGTALGLARYKCFYNNEIGGKTGTTQNYSDGWFMGITNNLVSGGWVGGDTKHIRFKNYLGEGARVALPIWGTYMDKVYADNTLGIKKGTFKKPAKLEVELDCEVVKERINQKDSINPYRPSADSLGDDLLK